MALGLGIPIVLHGVNNWSPVNGSLAWAFLLVISALLFLGYALVGVDTVAPAAPIPAASRSAPIPTPEPHARAVPSMPMPTSEPVTERFARPFVAPAPATTTPPGAFVGPDGRWWG